MIPATFKIDLGNLKHLPAFILNPTMSRLSPCGRHLCDGPYKHVFVPATWLIHTQLHKPTQVGAGRCPVALGYWDTHTHTCSCRTNSKNSMVTIYSTDAVFFGRIEVSHHYNLHIVRRVTSAFTLRHTSTAPWAVATFHLKLAGAGVLQRSPNTVFFSVFNYPSQPLPTCH